MTNTYQKIVIIGAGPAGLTAALELQSMGEKDITILEADSQVGGISKTINYKGNRIDIGGHRFFSKSDWVMGWWAKLLPLSGVNDNQKITLNYQGGSRTTYANDVGDHHDDSVMLVRSRLSRIYYNKNFFNYPLKLNLDTVKKLGLLNTFSFGISYVWAQINPISPQVSLEDFFKNRFGNLLYRRFFKEYTEKVWGVPCSQISAEWGAQRIKSLSITKALWHALKDALGISNNKAAQTSLIEHFIYPKYGPGQMWETAAERFVAQGGKLEMSCKVNKLEINADTVEKVGYVDAKEISRLVEATHVISTMPIKDLIIASNESWSSDISEIAKNLEYRDFITVGLLYKNGDFPRHLSDNWIYIQEPGVQVGRVQVFNNWSPFMVAEKETVWLGLEFFCKETDALWKMSDLDLKNLAQKEMMDIGLVSVKSALDSVVIKVPKAYPGYFGEAYNNFSVLREGLDKVTNLFLVGRNGMHRYNNQDHSMLTAKEAANQISTGLIDKAKIWDINIGDDYHEQVDKK